MSQGEFLQPLLAPVAAVQRLLDHSNQGGIIIGGVAVALLGSPRLTADVDALCLIELDDLASLMDAAQARGATPAARRH